MRSSNANAGTLSPATGREALKLGIGFRKFGWTIVTVTVIFSGERLDRWIKGLPWQLFWLGFWHWNAAFPPVSIIISSLLQFPFDNGIHLKLSISCLLRNQLSYSFPPSELFPPSDLIQFPIGHTKTITYTLAGGHAFWFCRCAYASG